jgi:hypothetical protein
MSLSPKVFEEKVERLCSHILQKSDAKQNEIRQNDEFWEQRNRAILDLTTLVQQISQPANEFFTANVYAYSSQFTTIFDFSVTFIPPPPRFFGC